MNRPSSCAYSKAVSVDEVKRSRKGQLQTLEPVLVVIFLGIIMGIGFMVFVRVQSSQATQEAYLANERDALATIKTLSILPELSCPRAITVQTFCIDRLKAEQLAAFTSTARERMYYYSILGNAEVTIEILDLATGLSETITIYNATIGNRTVLGSSTYFTVYDPLEDERRFAQLTLLREVG